MTAKPKKKKDDKKKSAKTKEKVEGTIRIRTRAESRGC